MQQTQKRQNPMKYRSAREQKQNPPPQKNNNNKKKKPRKKRRKGKKMNFAGLRRFLRNFMN